MFFYCLLLIFRVLLLGCSLLTVDGASSTQPPTAAPTSADLSSGLILYLPFSGNAIDATGIHSTEVTGATLTTDRLGNENAAYSFSSASTYIKIVNSASLDLATSDFTISAWIYANSAG